MTDDGRIAGFLARAGFAAAAVEPLDADASLRRFLRLRGPRPAVLMVAKPAEMRSFLCIARHLCAIGLSAPRILAADEAGGLVLQEDLGDDLLATLLDHGAAPEPLLDAAVTTLVALQRAAPPDGLPTWDVAAMVRTALATLFDWWWPAQFDAAAPEAARADIAQALETTLSPLAGGPRCLVHRDYFAGNLLWLPERTGPARIGIIDFQDAVIGHPAYDLVSLLQDSRREIAAGVRQRALVRYLAARPDLDPAAFRAAFDVCAAQRHLRVACQWVRLARRDGRPQYLAHGPRTWRLLGVALRQPAAASLAAALDRWLPAAQRGNPSGMMTQLPALSA